MAPRGPKFKQTFSLEPSAWILPGTLAEVRVPLCEPSGHKLNPFPAQLLDCFPPSLHHCSLRIGEVQTNINHYTCRKNGQDIGFGTDLTESCADSLAIGFTLGALVSLSVKWVITVSQGDHGPRGPQPGF